MKNAIVVLTRGYENENFYKSLIVRNKNIKKHIIDSVSYEFDFIIFHEGNISQKQQDFIKSFTPEIPISFINVKSGIPKLFGTPIKTLNVDLCPPTSLSNSFPLGYKHMCHFWSVDFLDLLKNYKYVIRIDEDCIVEEFDKNIINEIENNKILFASPMFQGQDEPMVIKGLDIFRKKYCSEKGIDIVTPFEKIKCPYTNFMIIDVENIINNKIIMEFISEIDKCGCIYSNRWGDLPIWGVILDTFLKKDEYKEFKNIKYYHGSHNIIVNK